MHDAEGIDDVDDDTIPQLPRADVADAIPDAAAASQADALAHDVAHGDTVIRPRAEAEAAHIPALPPVPAALRPHHRIRVAGGEIELDRPVQIGRNPRHPRIPTRTPPVLVAVASPELQISATHLELREHGSAVVATDLRTLNGSEVRAPGAAVVSLRHGESIVVAPGTRIDLGEGVVVEVLAPEAKGSRS